MASMKSMIEIVVDVGTSMKDPVLNNSCSKLELTKEIIEHFILQRMIASKTIEFGVTSYGDNKTNNFLNSTQGGYEFVNDIIPMEKPTCQTLLHLEKNLMPGNQNSDLIDAIVVAQDTLIRVNNGKAFNRILVLFTDGEKEVLGVDDLETVLQQMLTVKNFAFYIGMIGKVTNESSKIKCENSKLLKSITENVKGKYFEIENIEDSVYLLSSGLGLSTRPIVSKSVLEIGSDLKIPCGFWSKAMKSSGPSLKLKIKEATVDGNRASVKRDTSYRNPEDPELEVSQEERVKGFKYGQQQIPLSYGEEDLFKILSSPSISLIGTLPLNKVPRHHYLEGPLILQAQAENQKAQELFAILHKTLAENKQVALARFVKRENADPFLAVLNPDLEDNQSSFIVYRLPCLEDIRDYNFPSLIKFASEKEVRLNPSLTNKKNVISKYIDSLTSPSNSFGGLCPPNPYLHNLYIEIVNRILKRDSSKISMGDSWSTKELPNELIEELFQTFPLKKSEKSDSKKKTFWSEIEISDNNANSNDQVPEKKARISLDNQAIINSLNSQTISQSQEQENVEIPEFSAGSLSPLEDFNSFLLAIQTIPGKDKLISDAFNTMIQIIERNVIIGASRPHYKRAISCLQALRASSIEEKCCDAYNHFLLNTLKAKYKSSKHDLVWQLAKEEKLSLIHSNELASSNISLLESESFLSDAIIPSISIDSAPIQVEEEDDLFNNMM